MFQIMIIIVILVRVNYCQEMNLLAFLQDLQSLHSVDWLIIYSPQKSSDRETSLLLRLTRKTSFTYFSMFNSNQLSSLELNDITSRSPMILYLYSKNRNTISKELQFLTDFKPMYRFVWLVVTQDDINDELKELYAPINALLIITRIFQNGEIRLYEMYKTSMMSQILYEHYGDWDSESGLNVTSESLFYRRMNFRKQAIVVFDEKDISGGIFQRLPNYLPDIWDKIQKRLNVTSNFTSSPNFDLSIKSNIILGPSGPHYEYLQVLLTLKIDLFYKEVGGEIGWDTYLKPFSETTWAIIVIWVIGTSIAMTFILKKYTHRIASNFFVEFSKRSFDALAVLSQQGTLLSSSYLAVRMISIIQLLSSMILFGVYSALFISFITVAIYKPPFDELTLEGVLRNGKYNIVAVRDKAYTFFKSNQHPTVRALFEKQLPPYEQQSVTFFEGFQKVCYTPYKYLAEFPSAAIDDLRPKLKGCRISQASVLLNRFQTTWLTKRGSPYRGIFQICTLKLQEAGVISAKRIFEKLILKKKIEKSNTVESINLDQVLPLFGVFISGIIISFIFLIFEISATKFKKDKKIGYLKTEIQSGKLTLRDDHSQIGSA